MDTVKHQVGFIAPSLYFTITAINPTTGLEENYPIGVGNDVRFSMHTLGGAVKVDKANAIVTNPGAESPGDANCGQVRYDWQPADVDTADEFLAWFDVQLPTGTWQAAPTFRILMETQVPTDEGVFTSVASLKDFTGSAALKAADDEHLAENIIPRAEAYLLGAFGPFSSVTGGCGSLLELAANMLAEWIFVRQESFVRTAGGAFKSESMGEYSYTLADMMEAGGAGSPFDEIMQQIGYLLSGCVTDTTGPFSAGSRSQVFQELPGYAYSDGEIVRVFSPNLETVLLQSWVLEVREAWSWGGLVQ